MIDIDHFKEINDRFGHQAGDSTLQHVAKSIFDNIRTTDIFGRIGGEEFAIVLPETSKQAAADFAEKIRQLIEEEKFPGVDQVTICLGVTQCYENDTSSSLFSRADVALYAAKNAGRNRVVAA
jgi:diguanylate cyclase (GGDEF)-like protein